VPGVNGWSIGNCREGQQDAAAAILRAMFGTKGEVGKGRMGDGG